MGQTLTHGIYLPDEGERNCYDGLAANWQLLDGAVGTVAEHTTQIAGKAPLVHTHTKSDITDLLNSNFISSANNSYDLGSSSYQWKSVYAQSYYYKGTAWGLDKDNSWSGIQFLSKNAVHVRNVDPGVVPSSNVTAGFRLENANASYAFCDVLGYVNTSGTTYVSITAGNKVKNGVLDPTGTSVSHGLQIGTRSDGSGFVYTDCRWRNDLVPHAVESNLSLGTSTNKWKTLNGINPGALSLPDFSAEFDVSGQIVPPEGENAININWGKNTFTPSVNGWLSIRIHKATLIKIYREARASYCFDSRIATADDICVCSPVVAGVEYTIKIQATQFSSGFDHFRLSPCQGNV